jgi:hypothetical protein
LMMMRNFFLNSSALLSECNSTLSYNSFSAPKHC